MSVQEFFDTAVNLGSTWYLIVAGLSMFIAGLIIGGALQRGERITVYEIEVEQ